MARRDNVALRNLQIDAVDSAFASGFLDLYTGAQPAAADDVATGTLLASIPLPADAHSAASAGSASKAGTWSVTIAASGTVGWARMRNAADTVRRDFSVTVTAGGGDYTVADTALVSGGTVTVTSDTITQAA